ncbi:hypothetical protein DSM104299_00546 [Baekduia alba]|uniref:DUF7144 family membrane protein n=1 Tax=Baekduia alba TaxID=2997333 RepID=UPI00233F9A74|nr:hypothetical protein [Baekduia alba]WCB91868.1 hypothetical protein DSM104299_00546 [Baekduia alba]
MASTPHGTPLTATPSATDRELAARRSAFPSGWVLFAAVTLFMSGGMTIVFGFAAVLNDKVVTVGGSGGPAIWDLTAWGWVGIVTGIVMVLTGIGLALQMGVARWAAVGFVTLHAILMFPVASAFPIVAIVVIALDVVILYELTVAWGSA